MPQPLTLADLPVGTKVKIPGTVFADTIWVVSRHIPGSDNVQVNNGDICKTQRIEWLRLYEEPTMPTYEEQLALHNNKADLLRRINNLETSLAALKKVTSINVFAPGESNPCAGVSEFPAVDAEQPDSLTDLQLAATVFIDALVYSKEQKLAEFKAKFTAL